MPEKRKQISNLQLCQIIWYKNNIFYKINGRHENYKKKLDSI